MHTTRTCLTLTCLLPVVASVLISARCASAEEFTFGDKTIRVPDGYTVEQVTHPKLVQRPIAVARDEQGRLYVTDSGGMSERAEKQLELKPHSIRRLEDTNGDGIYDNSTLFADRMMFPEGCLWFEGSLYVAAPPEIWKLTDNDDDGVADSREVWFDGKTLTGCGNDLHGPYLGPDGCLYWCKGAFAEQSYTLPNGKAFVTQSSHIFRAKADGTELEPVLTGGMDNPVNVAFLPNGERFLSCTFLQFPEAGFRDGLLHSVYGGVYGKKHDSIYAHPMTGDVMPVLCHQGAAAPCGLIAGSRQLFGEGNDQRLYACYFNLHKVVRHQLLATGATYTTLDEDFVSCDHPDFHPTDVFEDADGSLLVVDTGGWYKVCCPTSQLAKPDVLGAVYRIRRNDQPVHEDPLGLKIPWQTLTETELYKLLIDDRLFVQKQTTRFLRNRGFAELQSAALQMLQGDDQLRQSLVWSAATDSSNTASRIIETGLTDPVAAVRQSAAHVAGLQRNHRALSQLLWMMQNDEPSVARAAAEAIGRIGQTTAVDPILATLAGLDPEPQDTKFRSIRRLKDVEKPNTSLSQSASNASQPEHRPSATSIGKKTIEASCDQSGAPATAAARVREHSLIYALIEIGDANATRAGLTSNSPQVQRAALVALDQMGDKHLSPQDVIPLMNSDHESLRRTAVWIVSHHPDWGKPLTQYFRKQIASATSPDNSLVSNSVANAAMISVVASLSQSPEIQALITEQLMSDNPTARNIAVMVITQSGLSSAPKTWLDGLAHQLGQATAPTAAKLVAAANNLPSPKEGHTNLVKALLAIADRSDVEQTVRLEALSAAGSRQHLTPATFQLLMTALTTEEDMSLRTTAAQLLGRAELTAKQRAALVQLIPSTGPLELPRLLPALETQTDEAYGLQLVAALQSSNGKSGLRADLIKPLLEKFPNSVRDAGQPLLTSLNASAEEQAAALQNMLSLLPAGDVSRGHAVFMGKKAACTTCHKLGYGGGRLGPDLSAIGRIRTKRDLLEAIMFPGVSIVRGYEPVVVQQTNGLTHAGIIISESREEIVLGVDATKTLHLARQDIEEILPSNVSPMPKGITEVLSRQELSDLLEFLLSRI